MHLLNSMAAKFPRTRATNISFTSTPPCKDFFAHSGNASILATRFKPRAQVMDVHDRTSQHFLHSSPILRGTLKGKDQIVIPNNRSILHTNTPPRTRKLRNRERSTTPQLTIDINRRPLSCRCVLVYHQGIFDQSSGYPTAIYRKDQCTPSGSVYFRSFTGVYKDVNSWHPNLSPGILSLKASKHPAIRRHRECQYTPRQLHCYRVSFYKPLMPT